MAAAHAQTPDVAARARVTWLIFVDDLHLDFRNTGRIRGMLKTIVSQLSGLAIVGGDLVTQLRRVADIMRR
jgi:hypothetical protein